MAIHIGKKIKEELYRQNHSVTLFAKKINRTRNVVYNIFERESIDTELLNKIGKVLNCDFFSLYSAQKEYSMDSIKTFYSREPEQHYGKLAEDVERLEQVVKVQANEIVLLKKINLLLEGQQSAKGGKKH
jgi:hypothetical protein